MSEHTPGPWECTTRDWRGEETDRGVYIHGDARETCDDETGEPDGTVATSVAIVVGDREVPAVWASAHLIAASPDLLAACEAMLAQLDRLRTLWGYDPAPRRLMDAMRAAVAKARGEAT